MEPLTSDRIWDRWQEARREDPDLTPERFASALGTQAAEALALLVEALSVQQAAPAPPLIDPLAAPDARFAGFELEHELGSGSSGIVYLARDGREEGSGARVALKILNPLLGSTPERRRALLREAEVARRLEHPGIVPVIDAGNERGYAWIALGFVEGEHVDRLIDHVHDDAGREEVALDVGLQIASALEHAHAQGVVHRDLKPANLLVDAEGRVHVLDFGLARADGLAFAVSHSGEPIGTPLYMSPEQMRGEEVGSVTDFYALGLILLELSTGVRLAEESGFVDTLLRRATQRRAMPSRLLRRVPARLWPIVARCLEPIAEDRYPDARSLVEDLESARAGRRLPHGYPSLTRRGMRYSRRHPGRASAVVSFALLALFMAPWLWINRPVEFRFDGYNTGKILWVNGVEYETTPVTLELRPGRYDYVAQVHNKEIYKGQFEVPRGRPGGVFKFLDCYRAERLNKPDTLEPGEFSWLQVSTDLPEIQLVVDGKNWGDVPGVSAVALPRGVHRVLVGAKDKRPIERVVDMSDEEACLLFFELDEVDSRSHSVVLYGPFDYEVRHGLFELENLRAYLENEELNAGVDNTQVNRAYFGNSALDKEGWLLFDVELPVRPARLEIASFDTQGSTNDDGGWILLEMGPTADDLIPVLSVHRLPEGWSVEPLRGAPPHSDEEAVTERLARVVERLDGRRRVVLRWTQSSGPTGEESTYVNVLRTHALPTRDKYDAFVWRPSMVLRVWE